MKERVDSDWEIAVEMAKFLVKLNDEYKDVDNHHLHSLHPEDLAELSCLVAKIRPMVN